MKQAGFFLCLICIHLLIECSGGDGQCVASIGGGCYSTWNQWRDKCYKVTEKLPWYEAQQECLKMGSVVVVPQQVEETDFLLNLYRGGFWIDCNKLNDQGIWKCQEGNTEVQHTNWQYGASSSRGNCSVIQIRTGGKWDVQMCTTAFVGMCKRSERPLLHL